MHIQDIRNRIHLSSKTHLAAIFFLFVLVAAVPLIVYNVQKPQSTSLVASTGLALGFQEVKVTDGLTNPTQMQFSPDGRLFVSEKEGKVRIIKNGSLLPTPFATIAVSTNSEQGLMGIAFDPQFTTNRYVYVYYTNASPLKNRVSRFTASSSNPDVAETGSELVILDNIIATSAGIHNGGALYFGIDGKLYISTGDASNSANAQNLGNINGKILRINSNGTIPTDNPFYNTTGARKEIYALGFRNPFTMAVDSVTGKIFVNDVGGGAAEEINNLVAGGNYGWPTCEGSCSNQSFINPLFDYPHCTSCPVGGSAITGGAFYQGDQFPLEYKGDYFFADYTANWIKQLDGVTNQVSDFVSDVLMPVDLKVGPDGSLYYLYLAEFLQGQGSVYKVTYGYPRAVATATPTSGNAPLSVVFSADGSSDPGGSTLTYSWDFGDGQGATGANPPSHTYTTNGVFQAKLTVTNTNNHSSSSTVTINVGNVQTVTFDDKSGQNQALNGQYPTNVINWGSGVWYHSAPFGAFTTKSISFTNSGTTSGLFTFVTPKRLTGIDAYNGGNTSSTISFSCTGNTTKTVTLPALQLTTIATGWTTTCLQVTVSSSNGWDTNFDNLVFDGGPGAEGLPPVGTINTPVSGTLYNAGNTISYSGSATDPEDGTLPASAFSWTIIFHHDTHTHPFLGPITAAQSGTFQTPTTGEQSANTWFRIHLTITDSSGATHTSTRDITPNKANITLATVPSGLQVTIDGQPKTDPYTEVGVVGFQRTLGAITPQAVGSITYDFVSWSDGGAPTHTISTPATDTTYTATFQQSTAPTQTPTPTSIPPTPTATPVPTATPTPAPSPTPGGTTTTVTFDNKSGQNQNLNGQYPTNVINWGSGVWYHSGPWGLFTTKSASFRNSSLTTGTFTFITIPRNLISLQVYNGGSGTTTVTITCSGKPNVVASVPANTISTIQTNWSGTCPSVTFSSTNGWDTNIDNLVIAP